MSFIDPSILECFLHAHEAWGSVMTDLFDSLSSWKRGWLVGLDSRLVELVDGGLLRSWAGSFECWSVGCSGVMPLRDAVIPLRVRASVENFVCPALGAWVGRCVLGEERSVNLSRQ